MPNSQRFTATIIARLRAAGCVFAEAEAQILRASATNDAELASLLARREAGEPLEHVVGWAEFCGRRIAVAPGVFVPRRRSEFLVQCACEFLGPGAVVVDLCCGTGGVGAAIAASDPGVELYAVDIDPKALACARRNLDVAGGRVYEGDLYSALPAGLRGRVDVVVANAPYVPAAKIAFLPREARLHEPLVALDGGADGVDVQRRIASGAPSWLAPGGRLLIETSHSQAESTRAAMAGAGLATSTVEDLDLGTVVAVGVFHDGQDAATVN